MLALLLAAATGGVEVSAQQQTQAKATTAGGESLDVDRIIRTFTAKEAEFRAALSQYSFKRDAVIQTIALGGQISGEYHRVSRFIFDDSGKRFEKILHFPMPNISEISITPEDLEDLGGVQVFALEASKAHLYNFKYLGTERIDQLDLYIFDVSPKVMPDPKKTKERLFQGRIWVDMVDFQIVKARGKGVPEDKNNRYPTFETYREQIDDRFWFPTYTYADDDLVFANGRVVHLRMRVKFSEFVKLTGKVRVIDEGEPDADVPASPTPTPTPAPAKNP